MESFALSVASLLLALAAVCALAWLALRLLGRRWRPSRRGAADDETLRCVRALSVGAKERVVLIEHRGARWLLGVTAGGISTIAHWPGAPTPQDGSDADSPAGRPERP